MQAPRTRAPGASRLVGSSRAMAELRRQLRRVAETDSTVLLLGETGTGKGLAARELHESSPRSHGPFVHVDCTALAPSVIESELFGHERGAFTGALARHRGRLERASGGSLFLDEVGELAPPLQAKLLTALQERRFERVGGEHSQVLDARIVAATHRDLPGDVRAGRFRADLYFRLRVVSIELPALRRHGEDLPLLVRCALPGLARRLGVEVPQVSADFLAGLAGHDWPGNVRELLHVLERVLVLKEGGALSASDLDGAFDPVLERGALERDGAAAAPRRQARCSGACRAPLSGVEPRDETAFVLRDTGGNVSRAARRLGIARGTLRYRIQRWGLEELIPED
jgi:DNA-binding NtrC family response regulator